ncbi:hypothetical protein K505DRAFT_388040, partial [Melanomma pulvis-pyrius CBS 109.77]
EVEDFPHGYPQFSRLFVAHPSFAISRKFLAIRARLFLIKQDELSLLEEQLEEIDHLEPRKLFLGNLRRDQNETRKTILKTMDKALKDYDHFVSRFKTVIDARPAQRRDVISLHNWVKGTGSINQEEASFLRHENDLMTLSTESDETQSYLETLLIRAGVKISRALCKVWLFYKELNRKSSSQALSKDPHVHIADGSSIRRIYQCFLVCVIILLLFIPVVIITSMESNSMRVLIIVASSGVFILSMSGMTRACTRELFIAGATYATVLVVFVAGNGFSSSD